MRGQAFQLASRARVVALRKVEGILAGPRFPCSPQ